MSIVYYLTPALFEDSAIIVKSYNVLIKPYGYFNSAIPTCLTSLN